MKKILLIATAALFAWTASAQDNNYRNTRDNNRNAAQAGNYRSTPEIVTAAGRLIAANKSRFIKKAQAVSPSGEPVLYRGYSTRDEENESIATEIARFPEDFNETAVIYRTNQDAAAMAEKLTEKGIPYEGKAEKPLQTNGGAGCPFLSFLCPGRQEAEGFLPHHEPPVAVYQPQRSERRNGGF